MSHRLYRASGIPSSDSCCCVGKKSEFANTKSACRHYQRLITSVSQSRHRHNARNSHLLLSNQTRRNERIQQPRICTFYSREIFNFEIRFRSHQMKYKLQLYNDFYFFITFRNRFGASRYSETISLLHKMRFPSDMSHKNTQWNRHHFIALVEKDDIIIFKLSQVFDVPRK